MNKQLTWKFGVVAAVLALSIYGYVQYGINKGIDIRGGTSFLLKVDLSQIEPEGRAQAVQQAIKIIRRRIDPGGVSEPIIQPVGQDRILVQVAGLKQEHVEEMREKLQKAAFLEFRLVHPDNEQLVQEAESDPSFEPPVGYEKMSYEDKLADGRTVKRMFFVRKRHEMTGIHIKRAYPAFEPTTGAPYVSLEFDSEGAEEFARLTSAHVHQQLAIVLDGQLYSAPVINEPITGGRAQISGGNMTMVEAQQLANLLENPLQAPMKIMEERGVDPSLGADSVRSGFQAAMIGAIAVVVFMAVYYLLAGMVANAALAMNILITFGVLAIFKFTLTLPGIAGIVLSIGMAVDTNVLIYERVREELNANKGLLSAIAAAYSRAFRVIFDAHFTAILTALILITMGSGPVKGFGVTLVIGLLANLFSGVFVTRLVFDWLVMKGWMKSFQMQHVFRHIPHINFLGVWKLAFAMSWALIIAGMVAFVHRGGLQVGVGEVYGIDFKGGDTATLGFVKRINPDEIRHSLEENKFEEAFIQYERGAKDEVLALRLPEGKTEAVVKYLREKYPQAQFKVLSTERVGAVVGKELLKQALWAVAVALIAIMVYIAFRFGEFSYGLGALVSLMHDVLMTVGLFCLWPWPHRTFSMPVVAAVLTLIGYSINDTIVVFDRIRENKKLTGGKLRYFDLINRSVNETLSRTILTAGTVFLCSVALYGFGGRVLNDFAFCFLVGVLTGTYSSIYIASPCVLWYHRQEAGAAKAAAAKSAPAKV